MAIGKITGQMLHSNLDRSGDNLAIDGNLAYFDVTNRRIGINTSTPGYTIDINGNAHVGNLYILGNTITPESGKKIDFGSVGNLKISGGQSGYVLITDGNGNVSFSSIAAVQNAAPFGSEIQLGSNTLGSFVSNALTLATSTSVTDGIALLNEALGRLAPAPPPVFPGGQSITLATSTVTARMASFTQTDNSGLGKTLAGGTTTTVVRSSNYLTSTITSVGPGNSGNVSVVKNGNVAGIRTMTTGIDNGLYNDLLIASDQDYRNVVATTPAGFYQSFNATATGTALSGWNTVYLTDTAGSNTNTLSWYYDASTPGAPAWISPAVSLTSNSVTYSSTIPHVNTSAVFTLTANISRLSGDTYYSSDSFVVGVAGGAFTTPASVNYAQAGGVTTPLPRNLYVSSGSASISTTAGVIAGFGTSAVGPSLTAYNSYSSTTQQFNPGVTVLYKTGTANQIEETALTIGTVGIGAGAPYRVVNPGSTDTPVFGTEAVFDSRFGPLTTSDATVVGALLKHDVTNYGSGYLPVGPTLAGRSPTAGQYFTFRFVRTGVSKFDILYTGTLAGLWVGLPGSQIDSTSSLNGWLTLTSPYNGSGIPGANAPGNGSNGCALGGTAVLNTAQVAKSVTATFGTVSSSSTANNYIYVRVKLAAGQTLSALQIQAASH